MGQSEHYFIGKCNSKSDDYGWDTLDAANFKVAKTKTGFKTTVICFGGNQTIKPRYINRLIMKVKNLIGIKEPITENEIATTNDVDFVGIAYGSGETVGHGKNQHISNTSALTTEEVAELAMNIFTPLYMDGRGCILSKEQMLKNFNQITFFSYCHGATEVDKIICQAQQNMIFYGIDKQTIDEVFGQIFSVSYAPERRVSCPGLQIISEKDLTLPSGPARSCITNEFLDKRQLYRNNGGVGFENNYQGNGTVAFKEDNDTISIIVTELTHNLTDEHDINLIARDDNWRIKGDNIAYSDEVSQAISVALSYSIARGIQNQKSDVFIPKLTVDEILQKVQSILGKTQNEKFTNAVKTIQSENAGLER